MLVAMGTRVCKGKPRQNPVLMHSLQSTTHDSDSALDSYVLHGIVCQKFYSKCTFGTEKHTLLLDLDMSYVEPYRIKLFISFLFYSLLFLCLCLDVQHSSCLPSSPRLLFCSFSMLDSPLSTHLSCEVGGRDLSLSCHTPPCPPRCLEEAQLGARRSHAGKPSQQHTQVHTHSHIHTHVANVEV